MLSVLFHLLMIQRICIKQYKLGVNCINLNLKSSGAIERVVG